MDEAHEILTAQRYRNLFHKLQALAGFSFAKLLLTASLPKRLEKDFLYAYGLPLSTKILRAPSDQPQISFNQVKYSSMTTKPIRLAIDIAKFMNTVMDTDQIGLIFCTSKQEVDDLESFTHCSSYSNHPLRSQNEELWKTGHNRWIAATTGLIQGIDAANVGATIFIGLPYGLINLYQGSGRGGRDGRNCWSISIIQSNVKNVINDLKDPIDSGCQKEANSWIQKQQCRRLGFSQTLDGSEVTCQNLPECHLCDFCDPNSFIMDNITQLIPDPTKPIVYMPPSTASSIGTDLTLEEEAMFESFGDIDWGQIPDTTSIISSPFIIPSHLVNPSIPTASLAIRRDTTIYHHQIETKTIKAKKLNNLANILNGKCPICWAHNPNNLQPSHTNNGLFRKCNQKSTAFIPHLFGWIELKKKMKFLPYEYCYLCQFPQAQPYVPTCHPSFGFSNNSNNPCPLADSIILLVWFIRHTDNWWKKAIFTFPSLTSNMDADAFATWLNLGHSLSSFYNGLELVLWFFEQQHL